MKRPWRLWSIGYSSHVCRRFTSYNLHSLPGRIWVEYHGAEPSPDRQIFFSFLFVVAVVLPLPYVRRHTLSTAGPFLFIRQSFRHLQARFRAFLLPQKLSYNLSLVFTPKSHHTSAQRVIISGRRFFVSNLLFCAIYPKFRSEVSSRPPCLPEDIQPRIRGKCHQSCKLSLRLQLPPNSRRRPLLYWIPMYCTMRHSGVDSSALIPIATVTGQ